MKKLVIVLAIVLFVGIVVYTTIAPVQASCEVCLEFDGELVCRRGAGATEEEARQAAQESACGGNVSGMSELIACRNAVPARVECSGP
jgi:hypothetical protein